MIAYDQLVEGQAVPAQGQRHKFVRITGGAWLYQTAVGSFDQTVLGSKIPGAGLGAGMFELWFAISNGQKIGIVLKTPHQFVEDPDYVVAYTASGRGRAQVSETLLKTDDLVIWNFPNRGTMAACPVEPPELQTIFEEQ